MNEETTVPQSPAQTPLQAEPQPQAAHPARPQASERLRPRTSSIVWGAIVLAFCVYNAAQLLAPGSFDGTTFLITSVIGLGVLLLVVGIVVIARGQGSARR